MRAQFTAEFLQKEAEGAAGSGAYSALSGQLNLGHTPGQANSEVVSRSLEKYRVNLPVNPVGKNGDQGGKAPWQVYKDYPVQRKKWLTYDPAKDTGLTNNPDRASEIPENAPRGSSKGTLASLTNPLFKAAKKDPRMETLALLQAHDAGQGGIKGGFVSDEYPGEIVVDPKGGWEFFANPEDEAEGAIAAGADAFELNDFFNAMDKGDFDDYFYNLFKGNDESEKSLKEGEEDEGQPGSPKFSAENDPYGVRWREFDKQNRQVTKERFFKSDVLRKGFCQKLETKDNFKEFLAFSDPRSAEEAEDNPMCICGKAFYDHDERGQVWQDDNTCLCQGFTPKDGEVGKVHMGKKAARGTEFFPLTDAFLCLDCEAVSNNSGQCPSCAGNALKNLSQILGTVEPMQVGPNARPVASKQAGTPQRWVMQALQAGGELIRSRGSQSGILKNPMDENRQRLVDHKMIEQLMATGVIVSKGLDDKGHEHFMLANKTAALAKKAADPLNLMVPEADAQNVAMALFKSGITEFEVEDAQAMAYFVFTSPEIRNVAAKIISHAFASQIETEKGYWGWWAGNEEIDPSEMTTQPRQEMVSSLAGGIGKLKLTARFLRRAMPYLTDNGKGEIVNAACPLCGHNPIYKEDPKSEAPHAYYCHACNRGFDHLKTGASEIIPAPKQPDEITQEMNFREVYDFLKELGWRGANPFYPDAYPWLTVRVYGDQWVVRNETMGTEEASGTTLSDLKAAMRQAVKDYSLDRHKMVNYNTRTLDVKNNKMVSSLTSPLFTKKNFETQ